MARRADFVIGVNGQSMEPSYRDGDKVFVEKADEIPTGALEYSYAAMNAS